MVRLKACRRLRFNVAPQGFKLAGEIMLKRRSQGVDVARAGRENLACSLVVGQRQQQMFGIHMLMLPGLCNCQGSTHSPVQIRREIRHRRLPA